MLTKMNGNAIAIVDVMPMLNSNHIVPDKVKEAIKAMGLSACQARCLSCGKCAHHAGK